VNNVDGSLTSGCEDEKGGNLEFDVGLNTRDVVVTVSGCLILVSHFKMVFYCKVSDKFIDIVKHREWHPH
jgi:hypothetical protein